MKKLLLGLLFLIGCETSASIQQKQHPTVCYKLEMCVVRFNGTAVNEGEGWPDINVYCIYGYDANGNKNGDVKRFLVRDAVHGQFYIQKQRTVKQIKC